MWLTENQFMIMLFDRYNDNILYQLQHAKKNGHLHNGKQNHYCKACGRQFAQNPAQIIIFDHKIERIQKLLIERMPLRGIYREEGVSLG